MLSEDTITLLMIAMFAVIAFLNLLLFFKFLGLCSNRHGSLVLYFRQSTMSSNALAGLEVSRRNFLQDLVVQRQVRH